MPNIYRSVKVPKNEIDTVLSITSQPTKTVYQPDEPLDITGLTIIADINGMKCDVTNSCSYSPSTLTNAGVNTITAMYSGYTISFDVVVEGYAGITITTPPSRVDYYTGNSLSLSGMVVTADYGTYTEVVSSGDYTTAPASGDTLTVDNDTLTVTYNGKSTSIPIYVYGTLEETSWATIQFIASRGKASQVWSIGARKSVTLNGRIGQSGSSLKFNNDTSLSVFILHFNYRSQNGILFGCFQKYKEADSAWYDVVLYDANNTQTKTDGSKVPNYNHWGNFNHGGWKGCDARYDILGSTNVPPSGYGGPVGYGRVGYDATDTCATNPVPNTLMSCFSADLRAVMAPLTIYTSNSSIYKWGVPMHSYNDEISSSVDYLPMLSEYEYFGKRTKANPYEQNYQTRPSYYSGGYIQSKRADTFATWGQRTRSPAAGTTTSPNSFVGITTGSAPSNYGVSGPNAICFVMFRVA